MTVQLITFKLVSNKLRHYSNYTYLLRYQIICLWKILTKHLTIIVTNQMSIQLIYQLPRDFLGKISHNQYFCTTFIGCCVIDQLMLLTCRKFTRGEN